MNKRFPGGDLIPLLLIFILILIPCSAGTVSSDNISNTVRINILSKHLRLLKEKKIGEMIFTFPAGTVIRYDNSEFYSASLKISHTGDIYNISAENRSLNFRKCIIYSATLNKQCSIRLAEEDRSYPLPVEIIREKDSLKIYVNEITGQYAIDSASAELGYTKPEQSEALHALALAIHGRCRTASHKKKHPDCDFCDLTCCQTYKGRSGLQPVIGPYINTSESGYGLFFHSSSGGKLFSESVFNSEGRKNKPPADILYSENLLLSRNLHRSWNAALTRDELTGIIYPDKKMEIRDIQFDPEKEIISIHNEQMNVSIAPEDFRLKINRKKGWNFLKSNNYSISRNSTEYIFRGSGLGHCTGMSLEGALQLAERGYSRYEILEHYYPNLKYLQQCKTDTSLQYITYNIHNGTVLFSSTGPSLLNRRIPCGSLFKLFTVIYLATERRDLFFNYSYSCGPENSAPLPEQCWDKKGHGKMNISNAIYNSCNIYFASLHDKIDMEHYTRWFNDFTKSKKITMQLPAIKNRKEWSELLAGLDFRTDISVSDIMKLSMLIRNSDNSIPTDSAIIISDALKKTYTDGTAKLKKNDSSGNCPLKMPDSDLWGKTGTVIAGTNSHHSYGLFTGGCGDIGITTILRKGKGADAAHLSLSLLKKHSFNTYSQ